MWILYAFLAAFFAGITAILAKIGIENVDANLAVAIRTTVVLLMSWIMVFVTKTSISSIFEISMRSWIFLILSGIATGASWFFFFRAVQIGEVSRVVPIDKLSVVITIVLAFIFLGETVSIKALIGVVLITIGTLLMVL